MQQSHREERRHENSETDFRTPFQRDCDRILHSGVFRRLAGVTQVVAPLEGFVFRNRLTHTLEVSQIARRIAEKTNKEQPEEVEVCGGVSPDVVEASSLAHDLGHPPFGHIGEDTLNNISTNEMRTFEGFEGNAQSFRIVTKLELRKSGIDGLDLTRATLNAILKYPWHKSYGVQENKKYGAFQSEKEDFDFARQSSPSKQKSIEAEIMDYADAVAYSIYDLDDFYRAGLIPLGLLQTDKTAFANFLNTWKEDYNPARHEGVAFDEVSNRREELQKVLFFHTSAGDYKGQKEQRATLNQKLSSRIGKYVNSFRLKLSNGQVGLDIPRNDLIEIIFLKRLVWTYVITDPRLATQQRGQRKVIETLFNTYLEAIKSPKKNAQNVVPARFQADVNFLKSTGKNVEEEGIRLAVDIIASLTDLQAINLYRRIEAINSGAISDLIDP